MKFNGADKKYIRHLVLVIVYLIICIPTLGYFLDVNLKNQLLVLFGLLPIILWYEINCFTCLHYDYQNCSQKKSIKNTLESNNFKKLDGYPIYYENGSDNYANEVARLLDTIKDEQKEKFISKGFNIVIGKYNTLKNMRMTHKNSQGVFFCDKKLLVLIQNTSEKYPDYVNGVPKYVIKSVFYHEWCHFIDYYHGYISEGNEVRAIYKANKKDYTQFGKRAFKYAYGDNIKSRILYLKSPKRYEFKDTGEYLAENYSRYRRDSICIEDLRNIFDKFENIDHMEEL